MIKKHEKNIVFQEDSFIQFKTCCDQNQLSIQLDTNPSWKLYFLTKKKTKVNVTVKWRNSPLRSSSLAHNSILKKRAKQEAQQT